MIVNTFKLARDHMAKHFRKDQGLKVAYESNIAMLLHDRYGITDCETRNAAAEDLMKLIFE